MTVRESSSGRQEPWRSGPSVHSSSCLTLEAFRTADLALELVGRLAAPLGRPSSYGRARAPCAIGLLGDRAGPGFAEHEAGRSGSSPSPSAHLEAAPDRRRRSPGLDRRPPRTRRTPWRTTRLGRAPRRPEPPMEPWPLPRGCHRLEACSAFVAKILDPVADTARGPRSSPCRSESSSRDPSSIRPGHLLRPSCREVASPGLLRPCDARLRRERGPPQNARGHRDRHSTSAAANGSRSPRARRASLRPPRRGRPTLSRKRHGGAPRRQGGRARASYPARSGRSSLARRHTVAACFRLPGLSAMSHSAATKVGSSRRVLLTRVLRERQRDRELDALETASGAVRAPEMSACGSSDPSVRSRSLRYKP